MLLAGYQEESFYLWSQHVIGLGYRPFVVKICPGS